MAGDDATTPALAASGLRKEYGELVALEGLDLTIDEGELVALVGHNGSGKSTFLGMVAGTVEPTGGEVLVAGAPAGSLEARASVSYLPDHPVLYDDLSVNEHLEYVAALHGVDDWADRAEGLLDVLGIAHRADDLPSRFSRGLRQKTMISLAMVRPFGVLLVDEPFVGLDPAGQRAIVELLVGAAELGAAVVVSTHQLVFLEHASRCVGLRDGALVLDAPSGSPEVSTFLTGDLGGRTA